MKDASVTPPFQEQLPLREPLPLIEWDLDVTSQPSVLALKQG